MNLKEIRELIKLMNENDLMEIELDREGSKIKLKKAAEGYEPMARPQPVHYRVEPSEAPGKNEDGGPDKPLNPSHKEICSPMVGTFYRAPSPESPPFVEIGQIVEIGQVVCIVEAMKLMNEIKSEIRGKIVEAPIDNAQPVEFGQALYVVEPV